MGISVIVSKIKIRKKVKTVNDFRPQTQVLNFNASSSTSCCVTVCNSLHLAEPQELLRAVKSNEAGRLRRRRVKYSGDSCSRIAQSSSVNVHIIL